MEFCPQGETKVLEVFLFTKQEMIALGWEQKINLKPKFAQAALVWADPKWHSFQANSAAVGFVLKLKYLPGY